MTKAEKEKFKEYAFSESLNADLYNELIRIEKFNQFECKKSLREKIKEWKNNKRKYWSERFFKIATTNTKSLVDKILNPFVKQKVLRKKNKEIILYNYQFLLYQSLLERRKANNNKPDIPESLKDLVEMTRNEIYSQFERKAQMETRSGFLLATWGIIFSINSSTTLKIHPIIPVLAGISLCFCILSIVVEKNFKFYKLESIKNNFLSSSEAPELYYVRVLYGLTTARERNKQKLEHKSRIFNFALLTTLAYTISIIYFLYTT